MAQLVSASHGLFTGAVEGFIVLIKDLKKSYIHRKEVRHTVKELNSLTNKELQDIGISRGDIWAIANGDTSFARVHNANANDNLRGWV